ncbi:hypothetical protein [Teredinibacter turnerae]|uniref:hypothetical protein n=1 Tax=Teredinibacter turnerae TaxID=2426 RepID=UPI0012FB0B4B|nr:hypothetical protein [Teredinibacter turnerae]
MPSVKLYYYKNLKTSEFILEEKYVRTHLQQRAHSTKVLDISKKLADAGWAPSNGEEE